MALVDLGRDPRGAAAARDPARGVRLQLDAGDALPPAPLRLGRRLLAARVRLRAGLEWLLAERGVRWFCVDQSAHERAAGALAPVATEAGPVALPIDWEAVELALVARRLSLRPRLRPVRRQIAARDADLDGRRRRLRPRGRGRGGRPAPGATSSSPRVAARLREFSPRARPPRAARLRDRHRAARPLVVGGAASGCARCSRGAEARGVRLRDRPRGARRARAGERRLSRLDLGRGQGPAHLGLAAGRRPRLGRRGGSSCGCCGALGAAACAGRPRSAPRASCSRSRRATGPSSTSAARPATTPSSAPPTTPRRCWRP